MYPTAPRKQKNYHLPFFSKFRLKIPKNADKFAQVSFFTNYLFSAVITRTHHLPTHTPFFRPIMPKKLALHLFLKITFFFLSTHSPYPETLPNHLFRQTTNKHGQKTFPKGGKIFFLLFIIYFTFSLSPYGNKQNHLLFPPFLSSEIEKPQGKTSHKNMFFFFFFFFLLFCILPLLVIGKITAYLFFRNSDLKCPKLPLRSASFFFFKLPFFPCDYAITYTYQHTLSFSDHNA